MTDTAPPELRAFVREYERRTNTHDFEAVRELIHPDAMYWFSDGTHEGIDEIGGRSSGRGRPSSTRSTRSKTCDG